MKSEQHYLSDFLSFIDTSPTAWHAVNNCEIDLINAGFLPLDEADAWQLTPGGKYYVIRNGTSICAFILPKENPETILLAAAHTDSPSFKLKPKAEFLKENMVMLGLEIYGSPVISSWLNRDLGIAGSIVYLDESGAVSTTLVNIDKAPVLIPQLAIHLDRNVNESGPSLNKQEQLAALASTVDTKTKHSSFLEDAIKEIVPMKELLCHDLYLYPLDKGRLFGENDSLISAYRLDNLASTYSILKGILEAQPSDHAIQMAAFLDSEEIGSDTPQGASSPFLPHVGERITLALKLPKEDYFRILNRSLCVSVDVAHSLHPNYSDKHEPRHFALLNHGIAIKSGAQKKYASDAISTAPLIHLCKKENIPYQHFIARGDLNSSGTTIGPIHASLTGMSTVDIGCPLLSMHCSREVMGTKDMFYMDSLVRAFYKA